MTLTDLVSTLSNKNVLVTINDLDEKEICRIYSSGLDSLEDDIQNREVKRWAMGSNNTLTIVLSDPSNP